MNSHTLAKYLLMLALLPGTLAATSGCYVSAPTFDAYAEKTDGRLATIEAEGKKRDEKIAEVMATAIRASGNATDANKQAVEAGATAAKALAQATDALKKALEAEKLAKNVAADNKAITTRMGKLEKLIMTTQLIAQENEARLKTLDKTDLPALKDDIKLSARKITTLQNRCLAVEQSAAKLKKTLGDETATREEGQKKLTVDLTAMDKRLAGETAERKAAEKNQSEINVGVQGTMDRMDANMKINQGNIAKCEMTIETLAKNTAEKLDVQSKRIGQLYRSVNDMLKDNKKLFAALLDAAEAAQRSLSTDATTRPEAGPSAQSTTGPTKPRRSLPQP